MAGPTILASAVLSEDVCANETNPKALGRHGAFGSAGEDHSA